MFQKLFFNQFFERDHSKWSLFFNFYEIQPALRIIARDKNITKKVQVILFREASALLALLNIELPLAAIPPIPSPLGLWSKTNRMRRTPENTQIQLII